MTGKFFVAARRLLIVSIWFVLGSCIALYFGYFALCEMRAGGSLAGMLFALLGAGFGMGMGVLAICLFLFNRGAFLTVDERGLAATHALGEEIALRMEDILDVYAVGQSLWLWTEREQYCIGGLTNAGELSRYISERLRRRVWDIDLGDAEARLRRASRRAFGNLAVVIAAFALLLASLGVCVFLTDGAELHEFTREDELIFVAYFLFSLALVAIAFAFASRAGRAFQLRRRLAGSLLAQQAYLHRRDKLPDENGLVVRYFDHATYRILVFPYKGGALYTLEQFRRESGWVVTDVEFYPDPAAVWAMIDERFADAVLEELP